MKRSKHLLISLTLLFVLAGITSVAQGKTIYMGPNETYKNLQSAVSAMSGGDTLIIRDGTYTGTNNQIRYNLMPPSGSSSAYTVVRAENPGKAVFDGQNTISMFDGYGTFTMSYVQFDGIQYVNGSGAGGIGHNLTGSSATNRTAHHIKFTRCGFEDNIAIQYASYILLEDCYVTGIGRYNFIPFTSDHVIFRRCVARLDNANGNGMPISNFVNYTSQYVEYQNCIAIDSNDQYYTNYEGVYGGFYCRHVNTVGGVEYHSSNTSIRGSIALNLQHSRWGSSPSEVFSVGNGCDNFLMENTVFYDFLNGMIVDNSINMDFTIRHNTFGKSSYSAAWNMMTANTTSYGDVSNSLFFNLGGSGTAISNIKSSTNDAFYGNFANKSNVGSSAADITTTNPLAGALKYLVRIESGSNLSGKASDGGDIGATILYKIGADGSMWGDTGYNTTTTNSLWPWPYEDTIRTFFRTYGAPSSPDPTRGFCADNMTLSKYIWEYLGNSCPPGKCNANKGPALTVAPN
ncbi:MAG TPA: chondroitinase-B domain-containing protein [Syntrophorhabdaceae bacterium]|nr:chondroitinase-B domain-containing protein [Syntrophorhabdaceae bacterium]